MSNERYPEKYGAWSGRPDGTKPNFSRCCEEVRDPSSRWAHYYQCSRKRGFGPDGAYCKQHDPASVATRAAEAARRDQQDSQKRRIAFYGSTFLNALRQIADGHNDPRALAKETIAKFEGK